jgi:Na+/melibiose symporter-like transporter
MMIPSIMNIGQGAFQLSHMSIVNSLSYDQHRRDILLNYRNSSQYTAGLLVPTISYFMFVYIDDDLDQFATMLNICLVLGIVTTILMMCAINEPKLIRESKEVWDERFLGDADQPPEIESPDHVKKFSKNAQDKNYRNDDIAEDINLIQMFDQNQRHRRTEYVPRKYVRPSTPVVERSSLNIKIQKKYPRKSNIFG